MSSFHHLTRAIRRELPDDATATIRPEESPPSACFHCVLDGFEYLVLVQPTRAATLLDVEQDDGLA